MLVDYKCQNLIFEYYKWQAIKNNPDVSDRNAKMNMIANERMKSRLNSGNTVPLPKPQTNRKIEHQSENQFQPESGRLMVLGGSDCIEASSLLEVLSTDGKWITQYRPDLMSLIRPSMRCAMIDTENILLTGGQILFFRNTSQVDQLSLRTMKKSILPEMLLPRSDHGIAVENGLLYVAGGKNHDGTLKSFEK